MFKKAIQKTGCTAAAGFPLKQTKDNDYLQSFELSFDEFLELSFDEFLELFCVLFCVLFCELFLEVFLELFCVEFSKSFWLMILPPKIFYRDSMCISSKYIQNIISIYIQFFIYLPELMYLTINHTIRISIINGAISSTALKTIDIIHITNSTNIIVLNMCPILSVFLPFFSLSL